MDLDKFNRTLTLLCPTCGGTQFETDANEISDSLFRCKSCQREVTKQELIDENRENITENIKEIGQGVREEVANELKRAFAGIKNIKIRI